MTVLRAALERLGRRARSLLGRSRPEGAHGLGSLERILYRRFRNIALLRQALTHRSAAPQGDRTWLASNERMEFLGDAVLNCLITEFLYQRHPDRSEGELSKIKSLVVSRDVLARCAQTMNLGAHLILGSSERKSGGRSRRSLLANTFEAVLGAVYLDGGLASARRMLERHLFCRTDEFLCSDDLVNYKSIILEMSQRDGLGIPHYTLVQTSGPDHAMQFTMRVEVAGVALGEGRGPSKKVAEQQAAFQATAAYDPELIRAQRKGA